jgi:GntR family transcriptional regulator/MocR family aminotransferase
MNILADLLRDTHPRFAIEDPGYAVPRTVFERFGYDVSTITVDENGLCIDELIHSHANAVYITPSHQYPTGVAMPVANRLKLLTWAKENDGFIIEDDYDSELTYRSRPIPSLQGLDTDDRVIYIGTFSKALSPALRVGYIVLPHRLLENYKAFHGYFSRVSLTTQKTLELFLKEGHWERHLRKIRNLNHKKHDLMKHALIKYLGVQIEIISEGGGLCINIRPTVPIDLNLLRQRAEEAGIKLYFTNDCSLIRWEAIRMGFGGFEMEEIEPAVRVFAGIFLRKTA